LQISDWDELKNKKLTKAETLKAAILYIQHLEHLLNVPSTINARNQGFNSSPPTNAPAKIERPVKAEPQLPYDQCLSSRQFNQTHKYSLPPIQQDYSPPPMYAPYFGQAAEFGSNENQLMTWGFQS
jgi:hypothetical protein